MGQIRRKSPFWSTAGPVFGYLLIQGAIQTILLLVIELPYIMGAYADIMGNGSVTSMQEIMNAYVDALEPALEIVAGYQVEILSLSALGTIVLSGILFSRDRKLEKTLHIPQPERAPLSKYWTVAVFGAAGCIAATCMMAMAQAAFQDTQYQQTAEISYSAGFPVQLIGLGVITPVAEELMFRGVLYRRLRERQGFWYSAMWSALLFSFMHTNTTQMIYALLLGVMLSYLYEKFGSFVAPLLLHILLNTGSVVFTELGVFSYLAADPMRMAGAVIAGAFVCSVMFVFIQKIPVRIRTEIPGDGE